MKPSGVGKIIIRQGLSLWIGRAGERTAVHSHHAIQITIGLDETVSFQSSGEEWRRYRGALITSHHCHAFDGDGVLIAHMFIEPESTNGRALQALARTDGIHGLSDIVANRAAQALQAAFAQGDSEQVACAAEAVVLELALAQSSSRELDPRILRSCVQIAKCLQSSVNLQEIAASVFLSPSRFRHLFVQETGLTFRAYVLWLRMQRAIEVIAAGQPLTEAAHRAGFADSAHLSRTFRRMFGIAPTSLH